MLLARAITKTGDDLLIIGLSDENCERLAGGQVMDISAQLFGAVHLIIFAGTDEASMEDRIAQLVHHHTTGNGRRH